MSEESRIEAKAFNARPEARFALAVGLLGAIAATAMTVLETMRSPGPSSAMAYVYLPFVAICAAVLSGIWGTALGVVWCNARRTQTYFRAVVVLAWVLVIATPLTALVMLTWRPGL